MCNNVTAHFLQVCSIIFGSKRRHCKQQYLIFTNWQNFDRKPCQAGMCDIQPNCVFAIEHIPQLLLSSGKITNIKARYIRKFPSTQKKAELCDCGKEKCFQFWCLKEPHNTVVEEWNLVKRSWFCMSIRSFICWHQEVSIYMCWNLKLQIFESDQIACYMSQRSCVRRMVVAMIVM